MRENYLYIFLTLSALTFSSCASILNAKRTVVRVITSEPSNIILQSDTSKYVTSKYHTSDKYFTVGRSKNPLLITAYTDKVTKTISVKSKTSFAYWLNIHPFFNLWTGFYIDYKTKKKYTYPSTVFIDLGKKESSYLKYKPIGDSSKYFNIIKFTLLKTVGLTNPAVEISYERKTGKGFSTQIMASYLLPRSVFDIGNSSLIENKGFAVSVEERFYFRKSAPIGPYFSTELKYLKNRYGGSFNFTDRSISTNDFNDFNFYPDTIGIKKQTYSLNFKFGYQTLINRWSIDFYGGLGLRYKNVKHFDRINPEDELMPPRHPNIYHFTNREGKFLGVSIPLNVKVGWAF